MWPSVSETSSNCRVKATWRCATTNGAGMISKPNTRAQAVRNAEVGFQRLVHAGDHVAHDFCRHVPDAQLFAQGGIEGSQEGFVEARDDVACIEAGEEGGAVHAVEGRGGLGQDFDKPQRVEPPRVGYLLEQRLQNIGVRRYQTASRQLKEAGGTPAFPGGPSARAVGLQDRVHRTHAENTP